MEPGWVMFSGSGGLSPFVVVMLGACHRRWVVGTRDPLLFAGGGGGRSMVDRRRRWALGSWALFINVARLIQPLACHVRHLVVVRH